MSSSRTVRKILITNIVSLNTGDAAILWGMIKIIRQKYGDQSEIVVFDKAAKVAQRYYPWADFRQPLFPRPPGNFVGKVLNRYGYGHWYERYNFLRFFLSVWFYKKSLPLLARVLLANDEVKDINEYVTADLILSTGGTYLIENYGLTPAIMDYRISIATGNLFGFFTQTLGPFREKKNRDAFKKIFSSASVILLRDERSRKHILELGVGPENIYLAADVAFVFARKMIDAQMHMDKDSRAVTSPRIAISVRSMSYFHEQRSTAYYEGIAHAVKVAVEEFGAKITFLSTCQGISEYWANDAETAEEVCALLPESIRNHVEVDQKFRQPWEIVEIYQTFDAVIATRMHAAILSLCAGTPTLGFAYEFKMEELFKNIEMNELVVSINSFSLTDVTNCVQRLLSQRDIYRAKVVIAAEKMCREAWSAEHALPDIRN